jgi:hypothetical protein
MKGSLWTRNGISAALLEKLARDATVALLDVIATKQMAWSDRVLSITVERFERRLSEEIGRFRIDMVREIHDVRWDVLRWMFVFWVGQFFAFAGLLAFMLRFKGP